MRDVILTAYACSPQAPCRQWAQEFFDEEPIILAVPGNGGTFLRKGHQWGATGDAYRAALRELAPQFSEIEIHRRVLITLGSGWQLGHHILQYENEVQMLDAYILEDGLYTDDIGAWIQFATRAAKGDAWFAMAHNQAVLPVGSSAKETNSAILAALRGSSCLVEDSPVKVLPPSEGLRITVEAVRDLLGRIVLPAQTKIWTTDSLCCYEQIGNLYRFEYSGGERPDQVYIETCVAPQLWRLLAKHLNK